MIFVTVGMHARQFDRLVRVADEMAALVQEPVVIQRGSASYVPVSAQSFDFVDEDRLQKWLAEARAVVSHSGAGSILRILEMEKPLVLIPRLKSLGEVIDDHQLELAQMLAEHRRAVSLAEVTPETLWEAIRQAKDLNGHIAATAGLPDALRVWLDQQAPQTHFHPLRLLHRVLSRE